MATRQQRKRVLDCDCPEGLEGECPACQQEALEQAIDAQIMQAEEDSLVEA